MSLFDMSALLLTLSALFGWINRRFLHLPRSIGLLLMGLAASLLLIGAGSLFPIRRSIESSRGHCSRSNSPTW